MTKTFARRTGLIAVGQTIVKLTQLILAIVLVRLLEPAAWNQAALLLSVYLAGTTLGNLNLHHGIVYLLPQTPAGQQRRLVLRTIGALFAIGGAIAAVLVAITPAVFTDELAQRSLMIWVGVAIAFELPSVSIGMALISLERWWAVATWDISGTVLIVGATVAPVAMGYGVEGLVVGLVVAGALRFAGGLLATVALLPSSDTGPARGLLRQLLKYSLPLGAALGVSICNRFVDKWFIAVFHPDEFGVYAVAAQEIPLLAVLPYAGGTALVTTLVMSFQGGDRRRARQLWLQLTSNMSLVVVPLSVALILLAPELIVLIFGREFTGGVLPFQIFTLVTAHRVAEYGMLLRAAGRTSALLQVAGITLASNTLLAGLGARIGGMTGSSIGTLIASAVGWMWALRWIAISLGVGIRHAFAWRAWASTLVVAGLAALAAQLVTDAFDVALAGRVGIKLSVYAVAALAGLHFGRRFMALPTDDDLDQPFAGEDAERRPALAEQPA